MNPILNYQFYNNEMKKGLEDKLFFLENSDVMSNIDVILDYGCANGALINELKEIIPEFKFVGFDIDPCMIEYAKKSNKENNVAFYDDFKKAEFRAMLFSNKKTALLLSSVIHEVYSYGTKKSIQDFWNNLNNGKHDYIIIRDMSLSRNDVFLNELDDNMLRKVLLNGDVKQIVDYQNVWGEFKNNKDLLHFLFKYRYLDNWTREVDENYFPIYLEDYDNLIDYDQFEILYKEHYLLPFQKEVILKDFGINIENKTHLKMILKRKNKC